MKIAIYQMDIIPGDPVANRDKVKSWTVKVMNQEKPDILVLPEMWTTAYTLTDLENVAETNEKHTYHFLRELALHHQVNIVGGSFATVEDDKVYNRAVVFNRKGEEVYVYDKIHLVPMLNEHLFLEGGKNHSVTFELEGKKMGIIICYDLRFPELARSLALEGAEVLFIVAEWPDARKDHWKYLQLARAIENQMFVVSCNRVGEYDGVEFAGQSLVVNPWGEIICEGTKDQEETLTVEMKLEQVKEVRNNVPVFESRVPHLYK
ncbi:carbon-nitrogen family hydrolase [Bacillus sp. FJAT-45350]|uniref:carbon-nitrogen family hydrolase n=1 Tax=Bacillus sp. FJAT-45350 TaxID=2011014 RepID=UPI000BB88878|nr:carbon-nitrogen family hydrolase [Bacillus sp. FJAT-45350]